MDSVTGPVLVQCSSHRLCSKSSLRTWWLDTASQNSQLGSIKFSLLREPLVWIALGAAGVWIPATISFQKPQNQEAALPTSSHFSNYSVCPAGPAASPSTTWLELLCSSAVGSPAAPPVCCSSGTPAAVVQQLVHVGPVLQSVPPAACGSRSPASARPCWPATTHTLALLISNKGRYSA